MLVLVVAIAYDESPANTIDLGEELALSLSLFSEITLCSDVCIR